MNIKQTKRFMWGHPRKGKLVSHLKRDNERGLTVRPEPVEGWTVKPFMVRQAHHERLNLNLSRLKWEAGKFGRSFSIVQGKAHPVRTLEWAYSLMARYRMQARRWPAVERILGARPGSAMLNRNVFAPVHVHFTPRVLLRFNSVNMPGIPAPVINKLLPREMPIASSLQGTMRTMLETTITRVIRETVTRIEARGERLEGGAGGTNRRLLAGRIASLGVPPASAPMAMPQTGVPRVFRRADVAVSTEGSVVSATTPREQETGMQARSPASPAGRQEPPVDIQRLADSVIESIDRRIIAQRERLGRI